MLEGIREGVSEMQLIKNGKLNGIPAQDLLDELLHCYGPKLSTFKHTYGLTHTPWMYLDSVSLSAWHGAKLTFLVPRRSFSLALCIDSVGLLQTSLKHASLKEHFAMVSAEWYAKDFSYWTLLILYKLLD